MKTKGNTAIGGGGKSLSQHNSPISSAHAVNSVIIVMMTAYAAAYRATVVSDAGPSANWLNYCFFSKHLSNSRNQYEMFSSLLFEVVSQFCGRNSIYFFN